MNAPAEPSFVLVDFGDSAAALPWGVLSGAARSVLGFVPDLPEDVVRWARERLPWDAVAPYAQEARGVGAAPAGTPHRAERWADADSRPPVVTAVLWGPAATPSNPFDDTLRRAEDAAMEAGVGSPVARWTPHGVMVAGVVRRRGKVCPYHRVVAPSDLSPLAAGLLDPGGP